MENKEDADAFAIAEWETEDSEGDCAENAEKAERVSPSPDDCITPIWTHDS